MGNPDKKDTAGIEKDLNSALLDINRRLAEKLRKEQEKKDEAEREERASLNREIETGSKCVVCGNNIVEYKTREFIDRGGAHTIGPGIKGQYVTNGKYYCGTCGLSYAFPPNK